MYFYLLMNKDFIIIIIIIWIKSVTLTNEYKQWFLINQSFSNIVFYAMKLIKRKVVHFKFLVPLVGPCILTDQLKFTPKLNLQYILVDINYLVLKILICKSVM